jgi:hypothetical protein
MPKKHTIEAREWFDRLPAVDPPGWNDKEGWCLRHWAPLATIPDLGQREAAKRLASLDLMGVFAAKVRRDVAPLPVPAHHLAALLQFHAPVCCYCGDDLVAQVIRAAMITVQT